MKTERARDIVKHLTQTISKMGTRETIENSNKMFKSPRAKRSVLITKRDALKRRFKL